ncbi:MAG: amidase [Alphaproteobacteria bacterium]|nr:amidase [Alphaproteobacteria bacterium]
MDLAWASATEIAAAIRTRTVSPVEAVRHALDRIATVNPTLNCFCFVHGDDAMAAARAAEAAVAAGRPLGSLHGVPIAIKDLTPIKGKRTTLGSKLYEHWVPDWQPVIVDRLQAAGAIIVGKTTTPEFAMAGFTSSPLWGVTRNPWKPDRSPSGSSGGSGAAVASGCVPLAEGSDMGGSVRGPASANGLVGLKPSLGRIPCDLMPTSFDNRMHFGPLARTVDDAALFLNVCKGPHARDIQSLPAIDDVAIPVVPSLKGRRLALSVDYGFYAVSDEVTGVLHRAADTLRRHGAVVEPVVLPWTSELLKVWYDQDNALAVALYGHLLAQSRADLAPTTIAAIEAGLKVSAADLRRGEFLRTKLWHELAAVLERYDALIGPTSAIPPPPATGSDLDYYFDGPDGRYVAVDLTVQFSLTAQCPVMSVPMGMTADGLPLAMQVVGRRFDDAGLLALAAGIEQVLPWRDRHPTI